MPFLWKVRRITKLPTFRYDKEMLQHGKRSGNFYLHPVGVMWIALNFPFLSEAEKKARWRQTVLDINPHRGSRDQQPCSGLSQNTGLGLERRL